MTINNGSKLLKLVNSWSNFCIEFIFKISIQELIHAWKIRKSLMNIKILTGVKDRGICDSFIDTEVHL